MKPHSSFKIPPFCFILDRQSIRLDIFYVVSATMNSTFVCLSSTIHLINFIVTVLILCCFAPLVTCFLILVVCVFCGIEPITERDDHFFVGLCWILQNQCFSALALAVFLNLLTTSQLSQLTTIFINFLCIVFTFHLVYDCHNLHNFIFCCYFIYCFGLTLFAQVNLILANL